MELTGVWGTHFRVSRVHGPRKGERSGPLRRRRPPMRASLRVAPHSGARRRWQREHRPRAYLLLARRYFRVSGQTWANLFVVCPGEPRESPTRPCFIRRERGQLARTRLKVST